MELSAALLGRGDVRPADAAGPVGQRAEVGQLLPDRLHGAARVDQQVHDLDAPHPGAVQFSKLAPTTIPTIPADARRLAPQPTTTAIWSSPFHPTSRRGPPARRALRSLPTSRQRSSPPSERLRPSQSARHPYGRGSALATTL